MANRDYGWRADVTVCLSRRKVRSAWGHVLCRLFQLHENRVHFYRMKNITLSADADLIDQARAVARSQRKTLNAAFREWLLQFTAQSGSGPEVDALMKRLRHVQPGRQFSREEMNER